MADLGDAIYAILSGASGVTTLVPGTGTNAGTGQFNIFPDEAPKGIGTAPYIVYKRISGVEDYTMDGSSNLCHSRVQIDCVALTYAAAKALYAAVFAALEGAIGTKASVTIQSCFEAGKHTFVEPSAADENLRTFGRSADFLLWHTSA